MPFGFFTQTLIVLSLVVAGEIRASEQEQAYAACISELEEKAVAKGIDPELAENVLGEARYHARVIELDRSQPEFTTTFADYLNRRVTEERVQRGRELLEEHRDTLEEIAAEYGVAPQYLVALWGLETNYGSFFGRVRVIDSLTTLACDERRSEFFTRELMAALEILEEGSISLDRMEGSWAGAMGHVQFLPSVFLKYAVDYDGDGRRDLWGSLPDAMASAANFLQGMGWESGWRWGREVQLPDGFSFDRAGLDEARPLSEWAELGVRRTDGAPLGQADVEASLLLPSGYRGPAFLVYDNFHTIMGWNPSQHYALAVGHLADRIAGAGGLAQSPPEDLPRLSRDQVIQLQERLADEGHEVGPIDGIPGPKTRSALRKYQREHGLVADGIPDRALLDLMELVELDTG